MTAVIFHSQIKMNSPLNMARAKAEAIINRNTRRYNIYA